MNMSTGTDGPLEAFTWATAEALKHACSQSGASNCGATALLNVLAALDIALPDTRMADQAVHTNSRQQGVSVSKYLAARSVAGTTAEDIAAGSEKIAGTSVESRFFDFFPPRSINLQVWLARWLSDGCSAIATLNTQRMYGADYWHHQMIYGVSAEGVFVTNGIEVLGFDEIRKGLESPSILEVRAQDVLHCCPFDAEACDKLGAEWEKLAVSQQLLDLRSSGGSSDFVHVPAAYKSGITIFAKRGTAAAAALQSSPELPYSLEETKSVTDQEPRRAALACRRGTHKKEQ
ncbi:unnamed protein product [Polarella glacialis]|uniref:Glutathione gamma-glutamylcysteinyltransferase n=1 Tax=Polarella glacialis TaxID=89957 RepID=A0A813K019_POLGL|nr:unnamed protein product [Polarella glacialis]CAE8691344.1 unnamed protein product [Polarella glacialis]